MIENIENKAAVKGFIHYSSNPVAVHSMLVSLSSYGVPLEDISVVEDGADIIGHIVCGDTVVINSLYDLSSSKMELFDILIALIENSVSLISLEDSTNCIKAGETDALQVLKLLKRHRDMGSAANKAIVDGGLQLSKRTGNSRPGRPNGSVSSVQREKYEKALDLYRSGVSMQKAAHGAGCNYSSFWYWYNKQGESDSMTTR